MELMLWIFFLEGGEKVVVRVWYVYLYQRLARSLSKYDFDGKFIPALLLMVIFLILGAHSCANGRNGK